VRVNTTDCYLVEDPDGMLGENHTESGPPDHTPTFFYAAGKQATIVIPKVQFAAYDVTTCWNAGTYPAASNLTDDSFNSAGFTWTLVKQAGDPASMDTNSGVVTFGPNGGVYGVVASATDVGVCAPCAEAVMELSVIKVAVTPGTTNACVDCTNNCEVTFSLSTNSYAPGGVTWSIEPSNVVGGASFVSQSDTSAVVDPGNAGTNYSIIATSKDATCQRE
jgi:hypothetical protein